MNEITPDVREKNETVNNSSDVNIKADDTLCKNVSDEKTDSVANETTVAGSSAEADKSADKPQTSQAKKGKRKRIKLKALIKAVKTVKAESKKSDGKKPKGNKSKPKDAKKTFKRLMSYMKKSKGLLIFVAFLVVISTALSVASTAINEPIVNLCRQVIFPDHGGMERADFIASLAKWLGLMIGMSVFSAIASYAYARIMLLVSQRTMLTIRNDLFNHIQSLPIKYFDTHKNGDIMSRFTSDVQTINDIVNNGITTLVSSGISFVLTVSMMIHYSFKITMLLFLSLFVIVFLVLVIGALSSRQFKKYQKAMGDCNAYIEEYIRGQRVVKVFSYEERSKKEFSRLVSVLKKVGIGANTITGLLSPLMSFISQINYVVCALFGATMIIRGSSMNFGQLVAFLSYAKSFSSPITSIASQFTSLMSALAGAERIFEIIDMEPEIDEGSVTMVKVMRDQMGEYFECDDYGSVYAWKIPVSEDSFIYVEVRGEVKFDNVTFGYKEDKTVLKNISLDAKPNEKIAFVGSTGAGKTTVTNLINRFYDIQEGEITVDGIGIKQIKKDDLRRSLSMVLQDTHLFSGTVADNIRYGKLDATDEEVVRAAKIANADSFITRLPEGYNTMIKGDGKNLSQGQRQLLSIARAAVADPAILILDEATSSIDTRTEKLIEKGMDQIMDNRTVFVIAHRLSTVRNSDNIMVLEKGEIIENGNHEELLEKEGKYYQLYNGLYELT